MERACAIKSLHEENGLILRLVEMAFKSIKKSKESNLNVTSMTSQDIVQSTILK